MDLQKLLDWSYLFDRFPEAGFSWSLRIVLLVFFIGSIFLALYANKQIAKKDLRKRMWQKIQVWGWTNGIVGLFFVIMREVRALYLSSRFWMLLFIIIMLIWLILIIKFAKTKLPDKEELAKKKAEYDKWLPKRNK